MKCITSFFILYFFIYSFADVPGNKPRPSYDVNVSGLKNYSEYNFYYIPAYGEQKRLEDNNKIHVAGGYGEPKCTIVWAVNNKTDIHTDTIYFCSGERVSGAIILNIINNHLDYDADKKIKRENNIPFDASNNFPDNTSGKNLNIMYIISGLSFIFLLGLVWMVWKNNRKIKRQTI